MRKILILVSLALSPFLLRAAELTVIPNPAMVQVNQRVAFSALAEGPVGAVEWQVVPPRLGRIDRNGVFTASGQPGQGLVRAVARTGQARLVGHAMVRVLPVASGRLVVSVAPRSSVVKMGSSAEFKAVVKGPAGDELTGAEVSWKVVPSDLGTVDGSGLFTPLRNGRGRVVAVAVSGKARGIGQAQVSVIGPVAAGELKVSVTPQRLRLEPGAAAVFQVKALDPRGDPVPAVVRFQIDPPGLGSIDASGNFTASDKPGLGVLRITAEHMGLSGRTRAFVAVVREERRYRVQLRPKLASVEPGQSMELEAACYDAEGNLVEPPYFVWRVVPERLGTITPEGLFTAGEISIRGKVVASLPPGFGFGQDFASINIKPGRPKLVRVHPAKAVLQPGETRQFTATVQSPQGRQMDNVRFRWKVFPEALGTITPDGLFTAGPTPKLGAVFAVLPPEYGGGRGYAVVAVSNYVVQIMGPRPTQLGSGEVYQFQAEVRDLGGNPVPGVVLEWSASSLSPNFGTIDPSSGLFTAGSPMGQQAEGNVYVRARLSNQLVGGDGIRVVVHRP